MDLEKYLAEPYKVSMYVMTDHVLKIVPDAKVTYTELMDTMDPYRCLIQFERPDARRVLVITFVPSKSSRIPDHYATIAEKKVGHTSYFQDNDESTHIVKWWELL